MLVGTAPVEQIGTDRQRLGIEAQDMERILILDDDADMAEGSSRMLAGAGYECVTVTDPRRALTMIEEERPDLLLTDLRMPGMDGLELLRQAHREDPRLPVVILTAYATVESAVEAVKNGAFEYLQKPFSGEQLRQVVERALSQRRLELENRNLREQLQSTYGFEQIAGRSTALKEVLELARKAARSEANVLVLGESGTGKELLARAIHANSRRATQPFVPIDCAALPENLLESELFGHEKGSFTGAIATKPGLLEIANRGTLFLDEIGELPASLQVKLLRALQERQIRRIGGTRQIQVDVRFVTATNRDLRRFVADGHFREDLYYRINVIDIALPPLRERHGDVSLLARTFLKEFAEVSHRALDGFEPEALATLEKYPWPGNVRELRNVIERACALTDGDKITLGDLPKHVVSAPPLPEGDGPDEDEIGAASATMSLKQAKERWINQLEAAYVAEVLRREGGNVSQAARAAGVDRKTLHRLLNKYSLR